MKKLALIICICTFAFFTTSETAEAADPDSVFFTQMFMNICLPNLGMPDKIRDYAKQHAFMPLTTEPYVDVFVGLGGKGAAWLVPSPTKTHFALSIRGATEACAIWAQKIDPAYTEAAFTKIIEGTVRPGVSIAKEGDSFDQTQFGKSHTIIYHVFSPSTGRGFEFAFVDSEKSGGLYQASIIASPVTEHSHL